MTDQMGRKQAVDVTSSVLVQAPAGSGKTTLLVERYIGLLSCVTQPEQILAITFTRKAASEMRRRILTYLIPDKENWESHEAGIQSKVAAIKEKIQDWGLIENPQRMQIRTIDSFCHSLARSMPLAGRLGPVPSPIEQPQRLYRAAARQALQGQDASESEVTARQKLLAWCDHDHHQVESLLAQLLGRREQWLPLISSESHFDRVQQDYFLTLVVERQLIETHQALSDALQSCGFTEISLLSCFSEAAHCLEASELPNTLMPIQSLNKLPPPNQSNLSVWRILADALLTKDGGFRKSLNKNMGFPPKSPHKIALTEIFEKLSTQEGLASQLYEVCRLPDPRYTDSEWDILEALVEVLRLAAQQLTVLFAQLGQSDFIALSAAALQGLGNEESGFTDLALYLDQNIEHILVDEYQDTNWTQFSLLEKLIHGWDGQSQRTLFMVGDPMQSIYRFREAEVGLFIKTRDSGIQGHYLEDVRLTHNFRSSPTVVNWVNERLGPLFPHKEDIPSGAIAYAPSVANKTSLGSVSVTSYDSPQDEALEIARQISELLTQHADDENYRIAVIVRARSHLQHLIPILQSERIQFRALKLDKLRDRPVVQDLMALTQVIRDPEDRTPLIALLRSPMIGLTLEELINVLPDIQESTDEINLEGLSDQSQVRAKRLFELHELIDEYRGRRPLSELVEGAWHRLGGPEACDDTEFEQRQAESAAFFDALAQAEADDLLNDWNDFLEWIDSVHTDSGASLDLVKVDILTMHGAKGLEWDAVFLPSLQSQPRRSDKELLYWLPFPLSDDGQGVLMAPLSASSESEQSARVDLIKREQSLRQEYELLRLMYVACTRAKGALYLSASIRPKADSDFKPSAGSILHTIWATTHDQFTANHVNPSNTIDIQVDDTRDSTETSGQSIDQTLYRTPPAWEPSWPKSIIWTPPIQIRQTETEVEFNWAGAQARRNGTVLHQLLEIIARIGIENITNVDIERINHKIPSLLRYVGTDYHRVEEWATSLKQTLQQVLQSERGQWILSGQHQDAQCEYPITGFVDGRFVNAIIDRTFLDETGTRWIIDYKSGYHEGGSLEEFLDQEADRYRPQLTLYAHLFKKLGADNIATALYLPRHDALKIVERE